jgi:hypothetical protein
VKSEKWLFAGDTHEPAAATTDSTTRYAEIDHFRAIVAEQEVEDA